MRLLRLGPEGVQKLLDGFEKEVRAIKKNAFTYSWYMRGGLQYEDAMNLSLEEYDILGEIIESNLETSKKSGMAFF